MSSLLDPQKVTGSHASRPPRRASPTARKKTKSLRVARSIDSSTFACATFDSFRYDTTNIARLDYARSKEILARKKAPMTTSRALPPSINRHHRVLDRTVIMKP
eukprot:evm.model.NODE_25939_length_3308_cov_20.610641.1